MLYALHRCWGRKKGSRRSLVTSEKGAESSEWSQACNLLLAPSWFIQWMFSSEVLGYLFVLYVCLFSFSCKDPAEPLTLEQIADRCHCPEDVIFTFDLPCFLFLPLFVCHFLIRALCLNQIEMIYKIIQHMAANDRAIIAEGSCGSPRSVKVYLGECNVDDLWLPSRSSGLGLCKIWVVSWNKRNSTNGWAMHVPYVPLVSYLIVLWWAELPWPCTLGYRFFFFF